MVKKLCIVFLFAVSLFAQQTLTLDEAISEVMKYFSTKLAAGTKVVVLNVESDSKKLSDYVVEECGVFVVNSTKLSLVGKSGLSGILKEKNIDDLNEIDEATALEIAKRLGASSVISGSISKLGENYRFRTQAVNAVNGQVLGIQSINIKQDGIFNELLTKNASSAKKSEFSDLSSVRSSGGLGDSQNARARLEAEMNSKSSANKTESAAYINTADDYYSEPDLYASTNDDDMRRVSAPSLTDINKPKVEEKSCFWLSAKFQRFHSYFPSDHSSYLYPYDSHFVKPGSFDLEIGGIKPSGFTCYGITNFGPGNFGYGVFLGGTTLGNKIFRFSSGADLGVWVVNTQSLEKGVDLLGENITYGRVRENIMFGGYNAAFLLGYNPVFLSLGFKALFGVYFEDDMANSYGSNGNYLGLADSNGKTGFTAMYSWNLGLTFNF